MNDDQIIDAILGREGGYTDHPADAGGPTNFGITLETLAAWRGTWTTPEDVKALTESEARGIYQQRYIDGPGFARIADDRLRALVIDSGVNHGPARAIRMLQQVLGVTVDGVLGPQTIKALFAVDPRRLYLRLCAARVRFYGRIVTKDPTQAAFAAGWANRVAEFIEA